jgi:MFS transporter, DHA2 family, multidrug resistance protein
VLSRAGVDTGYGMVAAALAVVGLGMGFAMPPALDAVMSALPPAQTGVGSALTRTLQQIGASFGVAVLGSILNNAYRSELSGHLGGMPARVRDAAQAGVAVAATVAQHLPAPLGRPLLRAAQDAYVNGMAEVLLVSAGLMIAVAVLVALFLPSRAAAAEGLGGAPEEERAPAGDLA